MNEKMSKILFATIAIIGYILNINNYKILSYVIWIISNTLWSIYNFKKKEYTAGFMFIAYDIFCTYGIINEL